MRRYMRLGTLIGAGIGLVISMGLLAGAFFGNSDPRSGETMMWLLTFTMVWSLPLGVIISSALSLVYAAGVTGILFSAVLVTMVTANWALIGLVVGALLGLLRSLASARRDEGGRAEGA